MFRPLSWLKYRLSHVKKSSWHYSIVEDLWGKHITFAGSKTCVYYWWWLPLSLVLYLALWTLLAVIVFISVFVGRIPTFFKTENEEMTIYSGDFTYPYKRLPSGKRIPIALWEIALVGAVVFGIYYSFAINPMVAQILGVIIGAILGGIIALALIVFVITKGWSFRPIARARARVKYAWDRACPLLVVEEDSSS